MKRQQWRALMGWAGIVLGTVIACFWAYWGSIETFHEGWFAWSIWQNLALMLVQYLSPMLVTMLVLVVALRWQRLALPLLAVIAIAIAVFLHRSMSGIALIAVPLALLGLLFHFGDPKPRWLAFLCLIGLPILTALLCGAYPGWRAMHRLDDGNYGARVVHGNGVVLVWAPAGPGWPERHASWMQAVNACAHLSADGKILFAAPTTIWRLPTIDEAVRSQVFRGENAGGQWEAATAQAHYRMTPDKDSPLWKAHSPVIYWWTSTRAGPLKAYRIAYNGYVNAQDERGWGDYWAFRCVRQP